MKVQKNDAENREECRSIMNAGEARQNGRMIRQICKRSSLGNWEYRRDRDHVIELLKEQERTRIQDADGVPGDYYVRQLWDAKGSVNLEKIDPEGFSAVASMCAWTLAHAHAKTGDRHGIAGYLGRSDAFDEAMLRFARAYADQNERDFEVFCASN